MNLRDLIVLGLIWFEISWTDAESCKNKISEMEDRNSEDFVREVDFDNGQSRGFTPSRYPGDGTPVHLRSKRMKRPFQHHHKPLRTVHGITNIIGWGILLPIGAIAARYFKKLEWKNNNGNDWYSLHVVSQISGFVLGTVGWGLGLAIRGAAGKEGMSLHGILGTLIFALAPIQVIVGLQLRVNQEQEFNKKVCIICHHLVGYALIVLIIANIFEGIEIHSPSNVWNWSYGVILGTFSFVAIALELHRWIRFHGIHLVENM